MSNISLQIQNTDMALRVLQSAPEHRINLQYYGKEIYCGALFCALGWIARVPYFRAQQLFMLIDEEQSKRMGTSSHRPTAIFHGSPCEVGDRAFASKLDEMFGSETWGKLFSPAGASQYDTDEFEIDADSWHQVAAANHKAMAIHRFEMHLKHLEHLQLSQEMDPELENDIARSHGERP